MAADNLFSEDWAIVACIDPDAYGAGAYDSDEIDMTKWEQIAVITMVGTLGNAASVVTTVTCAATSGASPFSAIAGKTTTIGESGASPTSTESDNQTVIHLRSEEVTSNRRYVRVTMTVTDAATDAGCVVVGKARYRPAYANDLATVNEIVN